MVAFSIFDYVFTEDLNTFLRILKSCEVDRSVSLTVVNLSNVYNGSRGSSLAFTSRCGRCQVAKMVFQLAVVHSLDISVNRFFIAQSIQGSVRDGGCVLFG